MWWAKKRRLWVGREGGLNTHILSELKELILTKQLLIAIVWAFKSFTYNSRALELYNSPLLRLFSWRSSGFWYSVLFGVIIISRLSQRFAFLNNEKSSCRPFPPDLFVRPRYKQDVLPDLQESSTQRPPSIKHAAHRPPTHQEPRSIIILLIV